MATISEYYPEEVLHPGETLKEKLDEMEMTIKEFALRTDKPEKTIIAVLKGDSSITSEMAVLFENVTRIPAKFWISMQSKYSEYKVRLKRSLDVEKAEEWARCFPYAQMANKGWVEKTGKITEKTINLFEYFAVSTHDGWNKLYMESKLRLAAYASLKFTQEPHATSAWLRHGELLSDAIESKSYDKVLFRKILADIKALMAGHPEDYFQQLQYLCLQAGVKVVYTPKLPKVPVSGSTRWIKNNPIIQLTDRYKQNDRFWFTFFHEAGHILLHGKKYISLDGIKFSGADSKKEAEANKFAEEWTFSDKEEKEVIKALDAGSLTLQDIIDFAKKFGTHPAMIIGRLQKKSIIPYSVGREFFLPIELSNV